MRIDLVGTTADFRAFGPRRSLPINHLLCENRRTAGPIGEDGLRPQTAASGSPLAPFSTDRLPATNNLQTLCRREMDSNFPFRARYGFGFETRLGPPSVMSVTAAADNRATAASSRRRRLSP